MNLKENSKAIYLQLADKICDDITPAGTLRPGDKLPSVREYAALAQVNANTVVHAYDHLAQQGVIANRRGVGYFVTDEAPEIIRSMHEREFLNGEMQRFFARILTMGMTPDDIRDLYAEYYNQHSSATAPAIRG